MAPKRPKEGDRFTLVKTIGSDDGRIEEGTKVTVAELVKAKDPGAHNSREDAVVVEFDHQFAVIGESGKAELRSISRRWSVGLDDFADLFEAI